MYSIVIRNLNISNRKKYDNQSNLVNEAPFRQCQYKHKRIDIPDYNITEQTTMAVVGIDIGTAYSSVAAAQDGKITVLACNQGNRRIASAVSFRDDDRFVGEIALNQISSNPTNTITRVKRIIGRHCVDMHDHSKFPFTINDEGGIPVIQAVYKRQNKNFRVEEITAMVISKMKNIAEAHLKHKVTGAVITVPANFTAAQRRATQQAASIAGFHVLRLINEPVAAAIAFVNNVKAQQRRKVLMFHLGAGYFSASVLSIANGVYDVKSVVGNSNIGGDEFTNQIVLHLATKFSHAIPRIMENPKAVARLRAECERAKVELSKLSSANIRVDAICNGMDLEATITQSEFNAMTHFLWGIMRDSVIQALKNARMGIQEIDDVVCVGGATRMPIIKTVLVEQCQFTAEKIRLTVNADEAAAIGAAVFANELSRQELGKIAVNGISTNALVVDKGNDDSFIVGRGTSFPMKCSCIMHPRDVLSFTVFEMELLPTWNSTMVVAWTYVRHRIGKFRVGSSSKIASKSKQKPVNVVFNLNSCGLLEVKSEDVELIDEDGLSKDNMNDFIAKASSYEEEEKTRDKMMEKLHELERGVYQLEKELKYRSVDFSTENKALAECKEKMKWIEKNKNPSMLQVKEKLRELEDLRKMVFEAIPRKSLVHHDMSCTTQPASRSDQEPCATTSNFEAQSYQVASLGPHETTEPNQVGFLGRVSNSIYSYWSGESWEDDTQF